MKVSNLLGLSALATIAQAKVFDRPPLSYAKIPEGTYVPPNEPGETTLLDFIKSRDDLSELAKVVEDTPGKSNRPCTRSSTKSEEGFSQALATSTDWQYTFFAPSNEAFNNTGQYYETFAPTAKGKWWTGQMLQHHYVPNSRLHTSNFTEEKTRIQMGSYLWASTQLKDGDLVLNNVATVIEGDLPVTNVSVTPDISVDGK